MRKKRLFWAGAFFFSLVALAVVNVNLTSQKGLYGEVSLRNIEALAQSEGGEKGCEGAGDVTCYNERKYYMKLTR